MFLPSASASSWTNQNAFTLSGGAHLPVAAGLTLVQVNPYGHLMAGQNLLIPSADPRTFSQLVADFFFSQSALRLFTRSLSLSEVDDPPDLSFRRFGPVGGYPYASGSASSLTGVDTGALIGEVRGIPAAVPFGGDPTTAGGIAATPAADVDFITTERPRDLTGNGDYALGTAIRFGLTANGTSGEQVQHQMMDYGGVKFGRSGVADSGRTPMIYVVGDNGQNQKQTITITGSPTGGTLPLTFFGAPPASPNFVGAGVTATVNWNDNAAAVKTALEALAGIGGGNLTVTGGPFPGTPIVVEFSGATVQRTSFVRFATSAAALTGGTNTAVATSISQAGIPDMLARVMLQVVHGGQSGDTPTANYVTIQSPGRAQTVFSIQADSSTHISPGGTDTFVAGTSGISFFNGTQRPKQTVTGAKAGNAALGSLLTALSNYGLVVDSTTA